MKKISKILGAILACTMMFSLCACGGNGNDNTPQIQTYTIQYTDDSGTYTIAVTNGMPYSIESVPTRVGYDFMGLYDAEVGGTQYVSSTGASLSVFTDKKNMVLFPQFKAKEYTLVLDYQGAAVTGSRQYAVTYGANLPELPQNLTSEHKKFTGWYTEADCEGVQIADQYGLVPMVSVLTEKNFDVSSNVITLYAGFETEKFTVIFYYEAGMNSEEMQIPYNMPISEVVTKTRVDGKAVLTWSKSRGGEVFNGRITDDTILYAVEYAPVIELDSNGGSKVNPIVARAGDPISLPTPTKDLAKFSHWEDISGKKYTATTMPSSSISLKAVWQGKLVFDSNGGSNVDEISFAPGEKITLPMPEKEGYIFAGWYTADKEQYNSTTMPSTGVALKAGWYKALSNTINVVVGTKNGYRGQSITLYNEFTVDLSSFIPDDFYGTINITGNLELALESSSYNKPYMPKFYFYSSPTVSESCLLFSETMLSNQGTSFTKNNFYKKLKLKGNKIYCAVNWNLLNAYTIYPASIKDFYVIVSYPDTSVLY